MSRTLLIAEPGKDWQSWLSNAPGRDFICLDAGDATHGPAGKLWRIRGDRPVGSYFMGTLDSMKMPHRLLAGMHRLVTAFEGPLVVQAPPYRHSPLSRQTLHLLVELLQPDQIVMDAETRLPTTGWPAPVQAVKLPKEPGHMALRQEQRRASWMMLRERGAHHSLSLSDVQLQGARLGSGRAIDTAEWALQGLEQSSYGEICGNALFAISRAEPEEREVLRVLDHFHCDRLQMASPDDYAGLLCCFKREDGEEFGYGAIETIDFDKGLIEAWTDAVPPVPVPILELGLLRVDADGRERPEHRLWQV